MIELINDDFRNHTIPDEAFVISDPPYNQAYHYDKFKDNLSADDYGQLLFDAFGNKKAVIIHYPEATINILAPILGQVSEVVSWVYPSNTGKQSRLVTWWNCKPDFRKVGQPYKNPTDKRIAERIAQGKRARLYDWWEINQVKNVSKVGNPHPCPIPDQLAYRIIMTTTERGDTIVDPFSGSGTIPRMAHILNRNGIGYEIDPIYHNFAVGGNK
jgi:site-specific DNA-methyltransferase (adenine-specific)